MKKLFLIIISLGSFYSCKKLNPTTRNEKTISATIAFEQPFSMNEIIEKLPQTILYNLDDSVVFYTNETKVWHDKSRPTIFFPINQARNKFLYAEQNDQGSVNVYIKIIYNESGNFENGNYGAIEEILDLQTSQIFSQKFEHNRLTAVRSPYSIATNYWEQCMMDNGIFELNSENKIDFNPIKLQALGYPPCGWQNGGNSGNIFRRFRNWVSNVLNNSKEDPDYDGNHSGGSVFPPYIGDGVGGWTPPTSNGGSGGGTGSMHGGDPRFNQPRNAPGFETTNGNNGTWMEASLNNANDPVLINEFADTNGYINTRKTALKVYLQNEPYGAIDCNDIYNLPMLLFQNLATYAPPSSVLQRIQNIVNANGPAYTTNNTFVQKITNGVGVVNMDFLTVHIQELPLKSNNQRMTPLEFLDFFRKNKSKTAFPATNGTFFPFQHYAAGSININKSALFNSDFANSLGAWVHIDIPVPNPLNLPLRNDGTVVLSDYHIDNTAQHYWYTFTTMATVLDGTHPVCGNRRFGITPHPQGGWQFYITGVDRVWDLLVNLANLNPVGFNNADILWESLQNSIVNYCNNNGGQAQLFAQPSLKARVKWDKVEQFLSGQINLQELKNELQCL